MWLKTHYRAVEYYRRVDNGAPSLVSDALNLLKQLHGGKTWLAHVEAKYKLRSAHSILLEPRDCRLKINYRRPIFQIGLRICGRILVQWGVIN